jgi:hypothetical protein
MNKIYKIRYKVSIISHFISPSCLSNKKGNMYFIIFIYIKSYYESYVISNVNIILDELLYFDS